QNRHTIVQDTHEDRTDYGTAYSTSTAVCGSTTDEASADGIHFVVSTSGRSCGVETRYADQSSQRGQECHIYICAKHNLTCVDTRQLSCFCVAAQCIQVTTRNSTCCQVVIYQYNDCQQDQYNRDTFVFAQQIACSHNNNCDDCQFD